MKSNHYIHRVIAIVLVITVLCISVSVLADNEIEITDVSYAQDIWDTLILDYVIKTLHSWGIYVSPAQLDMWETQLMEYIYEYLESIPSIGGFGQWIIGWQFSSDYWGNTIGNSSFLEDLEDFVNWLVTKLGLVSGGDLTLPSNAYSLGSITVYSFPLYMIQVDSSHNVELRQVKASATNVYAAITGNASIYPMKLGSSDTIQLRWYDIVGQLQLQSQKNVGLNVTHGSWKVYDKNNSVDVSNNNCVFQEGYKMYGADTVSDAVKNNSFVTSQGLTIHAGVIELPSENPSYTQGDSILIDGNGQAIYITIEWPDSIAVNNLPAVIGRNSISNPGIASVWHYVTDTIDNFDDGVNLMRGVVYSVVPTPYLTLAYAALALLLVFGLIKVMRK